ncbi:uncharacterized protein N7511_008153 [Penicillium nucicola]|uniref:uncharacterized protein n=1 Tax=Penicillium nucicola TaxID=1850975 RepID=UPI0025455EFD|nr:uncharacterized protein N7511_008153 [Penicillium nucicola]KAJ5754000.1 hypothetical protein N7511_008153 [Penicillium nucicola]
MTATGTRTKTAQRLSTKNRTTDGRIRKAGGAGHRRVAGANTNPTNTGPAAIAAQYSQEGADYMQWMKEHNNGNKCRQEPKDPTPA